MRCDARATYVATDAVGAAERTRTVGADARVARVCARRTRADDPSFSFMPEAEAGLCSLKRARGLRGARLSELRPELGPYYSILSRFLPIFGPILTVLRV